MEDIKEKKEDRQSTINNILNNIYIDLRNISNNDIIKFNILEKIELLGINIQGFKNRIIKIKDPEKALLFTSEDIRFDVYVIRKGMLYYHVFSDNSPITKLFDLQKEYNKITFELIDRLIEYKENKIDIHELIGYIKNI